MNLTADRADQRIVRSAVRLAHGLGLTVVAEGVECAAVAERLRIRAGVSLRTPVTPGQIDARWLAAEAGPLPHAEGRHLTRDTTH